MKIAVVASGWHFPMHFYEAMARQVKPDGVTIDLFCVAHRDPIHAIAEKKGKKFKRDLRGRLDRILYKEMATKENIGMIGWDYKEYPNTVGDWGNTNQWLEDHDYKKYDLILATHDDNLILHDRLFADMIEDENFKQWDILTNSPGMPQGYLRGSFEVFKKKTITKIGGKFDLSEVSLDRTGSTTSTEDIRELYDWNHTVDPMNRMVNELGLKTAYLSPAYRVSAYCIEGERGYISNTHGQNTAYEDAGLNYLNKNGVI